MMTTNETVSVWGCVVCSNVLMQGQGPQDYIFSAIWLIFALAIFVSSKLDHQKTIKVVGGPEEA